MSKQFERRISTICQQYLIIEYREYPFYQFTIYPLIIYH